MTTLKDIMQKIGDSIIADFGNGEIVAAFKAKHVEAVLLETIGDSPSLQIGFPTHTTDITGKTIRLGDEVTYDFPDNTTTFIVVFEGNSFRKKYKNWTDETLEKPMLEYGVSANYMRLKIVD